MALARGFHLERLTRGVRRAIKLHKQSVIKALRRHIFDGDRPVKSVPGADKIRLDCLSDIQCGVLLNENFSREFLDFELPRRGRRRKNSDYRDEESCGAEKSLPSGSMIPGFSSAGVSPAVLGFVGRSKIHRPILRQGKRDAGATKRLLRAARFAICVPRDHVTVIIRRQCFCRRSIHWRLSAGGAEADLWYFALGWGAHLEKFA